MKKKLIIFHPTIAPYRIDFFNSLSDEFEAHICLTWGDESTFDYKSIFTQLKFRPSFLGKWIEIGSRRINRGYWKKLKEVDPDVVITEEFSLGTIIVLFHRWFHNKTYKVVSMCDDSYNMLAEKNEFSKIHRWARRIIVPLLDELIVVEPLTEKWYMDHYGKGYCFPIIRCDDRQRGVYKKVLSESQELMMKYGLYNRNIFLYVGRFVALKNINRIIKAFSKLDETKNSLIIVGSGEEEDKIKQEICESRLNNVILTGRLEGDNLYAWYNVADYFVLASWQEAFGAVTNEALLAGCYCLVSDKAGSHCLIKEGVNGFTFNPMDVNELNSRMKLIIKLFPPQRPLNKVKNNLMLICYKEEINKLIGHINSI